MAEVIPATGRGSAARGAFKVTWIVIRLGLVIYFGRKGALFFYQGF